MLGLNPIDAFFPPLYAAGDMRRLVDGVIKNIIGRDNSYDSNRKQKSKAKGPPCRTRKQSRNRLFFVGLIFGRIFALPHLFFTDRNKGIQVNDPP